jgi:DNA-binding MarR family transcriptional regulator
MRIGRKAVNRGIFMQRTLTKRQDEDDDATGCGSPATDAGGDLPHHESDGYLVRDAHRAFQRLLERKIAPHGVTRGQWYFLRVLWTEDGLSQRELSERVGMMEPTTVIALRGMEKAGLIRRVRSEEDRRVTRVWLTAKAKRMRDGLLKLARGINAQANQGISREDIAAFRSVIMRMTENLDRIG